MDPNFQFPIVSREPNNASSVPKTDNKARHWRSFSTTTTAKTARIANMDSPKSSSSSMPSPTSSTFSVDSPRPLGHSRMSSSATAVSSRLSSPTASHFRMKSAASASQFRNRFPTQIRRCLPIYSACIILVILFSNLASFQSSSSSEAHNHLHKRDDSNQIPLFHTGTIFPRKLWQSWKTGPLSFEDNHRECARTWPEKNPGHRYEVLTDDNALQYIESHYGPASINRPDIIEMYKSINAKIVKADLLRYMVMYAEGGVYADIDVEALRPVSRWVPDRYDERDVDMVIGIEVDQPEFKDHSILGQKSQSFCQWTFMCKPRLPVMLRLIEHIMAWLHDVAARQDVAVSDITLDFDEVLTGTGPSAFTNAILADMTEKNFGKPVEWDTFHAMPESKLVNGVLVLTVEAFAAGQGHSDSGNHNARTALVKHHYHASGWPNQHPRYNHPIYGSVEVCNWVVDCVNKWDADVAAFEALAATEKVKYIAVKEEAARQARQEEEDKAKAEAETQALAELSAIEQANKAAAAAQAAQAKAEADLKLLGEAEAKAKAEAEARAKQEADAEAAKARAQSEADAKALKEAEEGKKTAEAAAAAAVETQPQPGAQEEMKT